MEYKISRTMTDYPIEVTGQLVGDDWHIRITGGCSPHIGCVSLA